MKYKFLLFWMATGILLLTLINPGFSQNAISDTALDRRVQEFLDTNRDQWRDLNIPYEDGQVLYDIIVENGYTRALEIGTSTGHSAIWIAWALSKTGGKLITIEINEMRLQKALENFREAGVAEYIDARLVDAHELVPQLEGPFDFVFVDADKDWYRRYLELLLPKMETGGCFTAHNVQNTGMRGIPEFLEYLKNHPHLETTINRTSRAGISISYKKGESD